MKKLGNKGLMGIGTLIIFIAVILVAAVAAAVLVSTSGSLQQRSLTTGSQAEEGVSTGAEAVSVMATDGSTGHDLEHFEVLLRLQAGSEALNLNNTVVLVDTATTSQSLDYGGAVADGTESSNTYSYAVTYVKQGPDYEQDYLSRGDVIKMKFRCDDCTSGDTGGIGENKKVRIKIIPRVGTTSIIEFTTPDVVTDQRITLWP
ncbi:MAG: hypothetical protein GF416_06975 [Candidatus Altiarchaeales archaeon]|nr:hypothetical protein [Candidatus Altiarchaeales archaeon]MBD3416855.1 hypothetical protein [Candidatus Altiarchaeales archaeon]